MPIQEALVDPCFWCRQLPVLVHKEDWTVTWVHLCPGNPFLPLPGSEWFSAHGLPIYTAADHWNRWNEKLEKDWNSLHDN